MSNTIPTATGDFAAFLMGELLPSIPPVSGSGSSANPAQQHNQYVLPTGSQLASWRAVFQSLLAGAWEMAHLQARAISSSYNVVHFLDASTGRMRTKRDPRPRGSSFGQRDHHRPG